MEVVMEEKREVDYKKEKKYFSSIGMRMFILGIIYCGIQILSMGLVTSELLSISEDLFTLFAMLPSQLILVPAALLLFKNIKGEKLEKNKISFGRMVVIFFICEAFVYIGNIIGSIVSSVLAGIMGTESSNVILALTSTSPLWVSVLVIVIAAPIVEEFVFRKILIDRLSKYGDKVAIVVSACAFGIYHGNITQLVYAILLGLVLGYVYEKSGRIHYSIILHMVINFLGSIVSTVVMEKSGYFNTVQELAENQEAADTIMMNNMGGLAIFYLYVICLIVLVLIGVILFFVNRKKITLNPGEITLEKGKRFGTIALNAGVILYFLAFFVLMILSI